MALPPPPYSSRSLNDVVRNIKRHWGQFHTALNSEEYSYSTLTYRRRSLPNKLPLNGESFSSRKLVN